VARPNVGRVYSRSHDAVIRVCDEAGNVIETHEHAGDFKEPELIKSDGAAAWTFVTVATVPVASCVAAFKEKAKCSPATLKI